MVSLQLGKLCKATLAVAHATAINLKRTSTCTERTPHRTCLQTALVMRVIMQPDDDAHNARKSCISVR